MEGSVGRFAAVGGLLAVVATIAYFALASDGADHHVCVTVPTAAGLREGFSVQAPGGTVGKVTKTEVTDDNRARIEFALKDDVWPLPRDSRMEVRQAGTVKYSDRYVSLRRGHSDRVLPEGGALAALGGQGAFAVLLFQDIAVIPMLAILPLLGTAGGQSTFTWKNLVIAL